MSYLIAASDSDFEAGCVQDGREREGSHAFCAAALSSQDSLPLQFAACNRPHLFKGS